MRNRRSLLAAAALLAVFGMAAARAWTSDDAFITFRVVDQFVAGHGPVFNIGERVQVFTHPLWFLLLSAWAAVGGSLFPGVMWLSLALFGVGLAFLFAAFRDKPVALAVVAVALFLCRTVTDFATGGLETPLSFALFAAATWALRGGHRWTAVVLLALLPLNRLDLLPFALPFAWIAMPTLRGRIGAAVALGVPAGLWMVFSTIYYGSPVPNTALAKLAGGPLAGVDSGLAYVVASLVTDPGALALVVLGVLAVDRAPRAEPRDRAWLRASAASAAIVAVYVLWTGGDFMLGRFLLPLLWALVVAILAAAPEEGSLVRTERLRFAARAFAVLGVAHLVVGHSATNLWLDQSAKDPAREASYAGAVDERRFYLPWFGAYAAERFSPADEPRPAHGSGEMNTTGALGLEGYKESLEQPLVDFFALSDPMLARLQPLPNGRPGHGYRPRPAAFWRWREPGYAFGDPALDALAQRLRLAHLAPDLWSAERWRAIAALALQHPIDLHALEVADEGEQWRIVVRPDVLFPVTTYRPEQYLVWLRVYDHRLRKLESILSYQREYTQALDGACRVTLVSPERNYYATMHVAPGRSLTVHCPKAVSARDGVLMRIGALKPEAGGPNHVFNDPIVVLRPAFVWWAEAVPAWIADGWETRPVPPLVVGTLLLAAALVLRRRAR